MDDGRQESRTESQKRFFDKSFEKSTRKSVSKYYTVVRSSRAFYEQFLHAHCRDKHVLEYGCGKGSYAFFLAERGAQVVGIDISDVAVRLAREKAESENLQKIHFEVMDAESMGFEENRFDLICGSGILHHLHIERAVRELTRVLKPEGKAIFIEPLGYNPLINLFRKLTPGIRTREEHPLRRRDLNAIKQSFRHAEFRYFHFLSLAAVPFRNIGIFPPLLRMLDYADTKLFTWVPFIRPMAWQVVMVLQNPGKA